MLSAVPLPYCGGPPVPGELWARLNPDPIVIAALLLAIGAQLYFNSSAFNSGAFDRGAVSRRAQAASVLGWLLAAATFISPLCALSVALFAARVAQQMILICVAAPLIAGGFPTKKGRPAAPALWMSALLFFFALWFWHMPHPYARAFTSAGTYALMHLSMFGTAIWLWRELLRNRVDGVAEAFVVGTLTALQMGLLGAILSLTGGARYAWHFTTTWPWGLTPFEDQQLGGMFLWFPAVALFVWTTIRSLRKLWPSLDQTREA